MSFWVDLLTIVVVILLESLFVHLAAAVALRGPPFRKAIVVAASGSLVAYLLQRLLTAAPTVALVLALFAWLAICASVYKTTWVRALVVGLLAYLLWLGTKLLIERANLPLFS
ncbi:MAG: hypothetical protein HYT80_06510 [Euryarchaeota archaeon]|nr:hypothetical protein [Euryarchaeota archaeon]